MRWLGIDLPAARVGNVSASMLGRHGAATEFPTHVFARQADQIFHGGRAVAPPASSWLTPQRPRSTQPLAWGPSGLPSMPVVRPSAKLHELVEETDAICPLACAWAPEVFDSSWRVARDVVVVCQLQPC